MKKIVILLFLLPAFMYADLSVEQIRQMVMKIHQKRAGIELETLESTQEPFVKLEKDSNVTTFVIPEKESEAKLSLHAILNGKAYINEEWKAIDETIGGYTLKYVGKKGVVLRNGNQIKKLFLHKERENFIMIEGRE